MLIKTKELKAAASTISTAVAADGKNAGQLELVARNNTLYLNVTNKEYFVSVKYSLDTEETFRAVVEAQLFLDLVASFDINKADTLNLSIVNNNLAIKAGKSAYKLALIFENDEMVKLTPIRIENETVSMTVSKDILKSILTVNSKELEKTKGITVNELQHLYYIDNTGCFTFTTGACLNKFTLEKPIQLLLNERIVKLFKLFNEDVILTLGQDLDADGKLKTKAVFQTPTVYVATLPPSNDKLLSAVQGPCNATKNYIGAAYTNKVVLSADSLFESVSRLLKFAKNSSVTATNNYIPVTIKLTTDELTLCDSLDNVETVITESDSYVEDTYEMVVNLTDLRLVLDSCHGEHITVNCGNHKAVIITHGNVNNLIPESVKR